MTNWLDQQGLKSEIVAEREIYGKSVTALPHGSVVERAGKNYVLTINNRASGMLEIWEVSLGDCNDEYVEARTGIFPGTWIVVKKPPSHSCSSRQKCSGNHAERITHKHESSVFIPTRPIHGHEACRCKITNSYHHHNGSISPEYRAGYDAGYQAAVRDTTKATDGHADDAHKHGTECGGDCKGCSGSDDEEIVFRKKDAHDPKSGSIVPHDDDHLK